MAPPLPKERGSLAGTVTTSITTITLSLIVITLRTTPGLVALVCGLVAVRAGATWPGLAVAAVGALIYAEQCHRSPYTDCLRCHGTGHRRPRWRRPRQTRPTGTPGKARSTGGWTGRDALNGFEDAGYLVLHLGGKPPKRCRHCRGRGVRMRWGRAVMNAYRRATYTPTTTPAVAPLAGAPEPAGPVSYADTVRRHLDRHTTTTTDRGTR